jgi:hypothetical protein
MAINVLVILLFLGLFPIGSGLLHASGGPGADLAVQPFVLLPWWALAGLGIARTYLRGAFHAIRLPGPIRAGVVAVSFVLAAGLFLWRAGNVGTASLADVAICVCLPAGVDFALAWLNTIAAGTAPHGANPASR